MAFRDNSTLIRTAQTVKLLADNESGTFSGANGAHAFVISDGDVGDDQLVNFGSDDSIITGKKIYDGNNDGYISFGPNNVLDVDRTSSKNAGNDQITVGGTGGDLVTTIRYLGTKDGGFAYADATTRDQLLGHFTSGFESNNGGGDITVQAQSRHIDNDVGNNTYEFGSTSVALLTDNALGLNFGGDTINGFGSDDLLIFTSKLYDSDNSGVVTFGKNLVLDLSGANGPSSSDPSKGPGGQFDLNAPNQTSVYFLGEKTIGETTYYYYGTADHGAVPGLTA
ncbi:hypothetical protein SAMN05192583_3120 [Sphingomonas gellani]|uniref:Uncharacterized protein n=1 Tax=Sphingomonas gellani TaxID=1166340 RepID=A0A1H8HWU2_9SPHN|nr:hypothetical protein [Sphingomonas gellani]SEN60168.1 hypothetical protein SAMN05192583_3120 [Sphingomonas gellani]